MYYIYLLLSISHMAAKKPNKSVQNKKVAPKTVVASVSKVEHETTDKIWETINDVVVLDKKEEVNKETKPKTSRTSQELQKARSSKMTYIWVLLWLGVVVFVLWWLKIIKTWFAIGLGIVILAGIWIKAYDYDLDLWTLWKTWNIAASRIQTTDKWVILMWECVKPVNNTDSNDLDCANFTTQEEAQAKYDECASQIASYNKWKTEEEIKSLDIYGLDKNKNGIVCEHLPIMAPAQ